LRNSSDKDTRPNTKVKIRYTDMRLPQGITVFRNSVILLSWSDTPTAIKITSQTYAKQFSDFFLDLWKTAKK